MRKYCIGEIFAPGSPFLNIDIDSSLAEGLKEKLELVDGVIFIVEKHSLHDMRYTVGISPRADEEDIQIIRRDLDTACNAHIEQGENIEKALNGRA